MTWGGDLKPTAEPAKVVSSGSPSDLAPGKSTRTGRQGPSYTGDDYVDHGAACEGASGDLNCFLPKDVRDREDQKLGLRIADVGNMFQRACDVVSLHRMMTPATQPNFLVGLLFDVLLSRFSTMLVAEFVAVRSAAIARASSMELELKNLGGVKNRFLAIEPAALTAKLALTVSKAKAVVITSASADTATIAQAFIESLKTGAAIGFTALREGLPAVANDFELLAYTDSFAPERHPQPVYQQLINEKIDRYLASGVAKIGRTGDNERHTPNSREDIDPWAAVDVRVAWARYASGYPAQLVYQHASSRRDAVPSATTPSFGEGGGVNGQPGTSERGMIGDKNWRKVPLEFADLALQRHMVFWKTYPMTVDVDDTNWVDDPIRMQMAYRKGHLDDRVPVGGATAGPIAHTIVKQGDPQAPQDWTKPDEGGQ